MKRNVALDGVQPSAARDADQPASMTQTDADNPLYSAYCLTIRSQLPLPELVPATVSQAADVEICFGTAPQQLDNPSGRGVLYQANPQQFLLSMDGIARYLVEDGRRITIDAAPGASESDLRVFLLGSCIGALLHQRGILAFHAATIATERGAVLFTGPSGIGKSTLLAAFLKRGYRMLADDVTGVILDDEQRPLVLPAFPRTKLWADAAQALDHDVSTLTPTRPGVNKFELHVAPHFDGTPLPLWRIYRLSINNQDELSLTAMQPISNFSNVLYNTYREQFLDGLSMREAHFHLISAVARHSAMWLVRRPSGAFLLDQLVDLIEENLHA